MIKADEINNHQKLIEIYINDFNNYWNEQLQSIITSRYNQTKLKHIKGFN